MQMKYQKIYTAVAIIFGVLFLYALYNFADALIRNYGFNGSYLLYFAPVLFGITGLIIFVTSGYKKSGLLRMFMCYELFSFPFTVFYYVNLLQHNTGGQQYTFTASWQFYLGIFFNLVYVATSTVGLWYISKSRIPKIIYFGHGQSRVGQFTPAQAGVRFLNRLTDGVIIVLVVIRSITSFFSFRNSSHGYNGYDTNIGDSPLLLYAIEIPAIIIYYLLLEGIFNTTTGKSATNTVIVNENGSRPSFGQILGRTFSRLIPFEAFSFFAAGARGWHDSLPNTYVVESIDADDEWEHEITLDAELDNLNYESSNTTGSAGKRNN